jgi:hypothetical protein
LCWSGAPGGGRNGRRNLWTDLTEITSCFKNTIPIKQHRILLLSTNTLATNMPKTSDRKKDCITVGGTTLTKQQLINRVISFEKMSKTQLTKRKKELKDKDCKALVKMLIPPRESKSPKKPAAKKPAAKAKATAKTAAAAALQSLPPSIAKELAKTESFIQWVKAAGGKPVKTVPSKKKKADDSDSDSDSDSDCDSDSDSDLDSDSDSE